MSLGFVLFELDGRTFATPLDGVREIVRLAGVERLPGMRTPLAGITVVRGTPLPVLDVRAEQDATGDVLVVHDEGEQVGVAVDKVIAIAADDELPATVDASRALPPYVVGVRRHIRDTVLLVDLHLLLDAVAGGWTAAVPDAAIPSPR